jgi:hypothetical protein
MTDNNNFQNHSDEPHFALHEYNYTKLKLSELI